MLPSAAMLDPRALAERRDEIVESCRRRGIEADVDAAVRAQQDVTSAQTGLNQLNQQRNEHQAGGQQKLSEDERKAHVEKGRALKEQVAEAEARRAAAREALDATLPSLPNFVHPDSPVGGEDDFREIRRVGEPTSFDFEPQDHLAITERLSLLDFESGAKVAGPKWYYLKNEAVLLELALQRFAIDVLLEEGYAPLLTPDVARRSMVDAMAFSPRGPETQIYSIEGTDLDLIGTAEITLGALHADSVLAEADLPIRLAGLSHCYRTEAGSAGRESKGLYRVHQFTKVEMFIFSRPEDSEALHEELLRIEERIFRDLELPYRVIEVATGDLGAPAYRKYDIEAWITGRVHTLNGTAIAMPRALIALVENHQRADGSIGIPKALQRYFGRESIGAR